MPEFSGDDVACIIKHYLAIPQTLDQIGGFNLIFERLWINFIVDRRRKDVSKDELWQEMTRLRKTGVLPRKKRAARKPKSPQAEPVTKDLFDEQKQDQGDVPRKKNKNH